MELDDITGAIVDASIGIHRFPGRVCSNRSMSLFSRASCDSEACVSTVSD